ncbi:uncharacterized protein [Ptychodera flava]|uniref:uncharacterized protein n=1 Tax=Ptychodera flava TaxID=63121 RepID=UPI00396A75BF
MATKHIHTLFILAALFQLTHQAQEPKLTVVLCPSDFTVGTDSGVDYATVWWTEPTVLNGSLEIETMSNYMQGDQFPIGDTRVAYKDVNTNSNELCAFVITVTDVERPTFLECPTEDLYYGTVSTERYVTWNIPEADDNSGSVDVTSTLTPPALLETGQTTVTYTASDAAGNRGTCQVSLSILRLQDIPEDRKFTIRMLILNAEYSDELGNSSSLQFNNLAHRLEVPINDILLYWWRHVNPFCAVAQFGPGDGVTANVTLVHDEDIYGNLQLAFLREVYSSVKTDPILGDLALDEHIQVYENDGTVSNVTWCYVKPCPEGVTCQSLDDKCIATCAENPTYCRNGGTCRQNSFSYTISCRCPSSTYYGKRCQIEDIITDAQLIAIIASAAWFCVLLVGGCIICSAYTRKCCCSRNKDDDPKRAPAVEPSLEMHQVYLPPSSSTRNLLPGNDNLVSTDPVYQDFIIGAATVRDGNVEFRNERTVQR